MKKRYEMTDYTCDNCGIENKAQRDFPYVTDWVYLYNLEFKLLRLDNSRRGEKHFCSFKCMKSYIIKELNKRYKQHSQNQIARSKLNPPKSKKKVKRRKTSSRRIKR